MNTGDLVLKDPNASAWPRIINWTDYLAEIGVSETISTSSWAITGGDVAVSPLPATVLTIDAASQSIVTGNKKTQLKLSAGTVGRDYTVTNSIVTSSGIHDDRSFVVRIRNQ